MRFVIFAGVALVVVLTGLIFFRDTNQIYTRVDRDDNHPYISFAPTPSNNDNRQPLYTYPEFGLSGAERINDVNIISIVFVPQDADETIPARWRENTVYINNEIKRFFEREFERNMRITQSYPKIVYGDMTLDKYTPLSIAREVKQKTKTLNNASAYNVRMVYLVRDKNLDKEYVLDVSVINQQVHFMYVFWLEDEAITGSDQYGLTGSAHEFGHLLGMPHPWDLPENKGSNAQEVNAEHRGDIMSYDTYGYELKDLYVDPVVKRRMGLYNQ